MQSDAPFDTRCTRTNMTAGEKAEPNPLLSFTWNTVSPIVRPRQCFGYGRRPAREAVGQVGMRTRKKRMAACNGSHKGSKFALIRKGADFRVVQLSQARVRDSIEGSLREAGKRRFSVLVPVREWINDAMFAKDLWSSARPALARRLMLCASLVR